MADLTPLEAIQRYVAGELPTARANVDSPHTVGGSWFLDLEWNGAIAIIEWRPSEGFGIAGEDTAYGEGPTIVTREANEAAAAAVNYLRTHTGVRDALIVAEEVSLREQLRNDLYHVDVFPDTAATTDDAITRLSAHVYRSVVVELPALPAASDDLNRLGSFLVSIDVMTIAIVTGEETATQLMPDWASIFLRRPVEPRELALLIRSLLRYGDRVRHWRKIRDTDSVDSN